MSENNTNFKTLVYGASLKPYRYAHRAVKILKINGYDVVPLGRAEGEIDGIKILTGHPEVTNIHTVSMYLNPALQPDHYDYILSLNPQRIIFNPGAENPELARLAAAKGIFTEDACTLVLLSVGQYEN